MSPRALVCVCQRERGPSWPQRSDQWICNIKEWVPNTFALLFSITITILLSFVPLIQQNWATEALWCAAPCVLVCVIVCLCVLLQDPTGFSIIDHLQAHTKLLSFKAAIYNIQNSFIQFKVNNYETKWTEVWSRSVFSLKLAYIRISL